MSLNTLIAAIDLGTSATTASLGRVRESFDADGQLHREKLGSIFDVTDWPGCIGDAIGNACVPTDLIFRKSTGELLYWGFEAQHYLDDPSPDILPCDVFVVETIKLLLPNPNDSEIDSAATARYRAKREELTATLGKQPYEVFEDFLTKVVSHVITNAKGRFSNRINDHQVELVLAFPSGWPDHIHTAVARIGARSMEKAIKAHTLTNMIFGIENVYTVSETLCGVKEWLREEIVTESSSSIDPQTTNLDDLNEGDCFLPVDIGGGTGCLTPLRLVTKNPLGVEQLDKTQSLDVSGEAVQAEFERWLRPKITKKDYPRDIKRLIYQVCRKFKEEKKKCGVPSILGSKTWNFSVPGLKPNARKGFEKDCMKFNRHDLEKCFDPAIDILDLAIETTMRRFPSIKVIVFLGQFGGSSAYLQKRMASNPISHSVKIRHSKSGKLDVVKGAISERLTLEETFVRKFETLKSYGTLVTLLYGKEAEEAFPKPQAHGAVPFECADDGLRLKVIEWAIPKGTVLKDGRTHDIGQDESRFHTWRFREKNIEFEDIIIVSDELVPTPQLRGKSFTLWTKAHEKNELYIENKRIQVHQIPFSWNLAMSQKLNSEGIIVGSYAIDDLSDFMYPEKMLKGHRRKHLRDLHYNLIWDITEMQVKVHVQATFPNQVGPSMAQLAKEEVLGPDKKMKGESRSKALVKDIEIANTLTAVNVEDEDVDDDNDDDDDVDDDDTLDRDGQESLADVYGPTGLELFTEILAKEHQQQVRGGFQETDERDQQHLGTEVYPPMSSLGNQLVRKKARQAVPTELSQEIREDYSGTSAPANVVEQSRVLLGLARGTDQSTAATSTSYSKTDRRYRDGCYTCKDRKKKCDCTFAFDETSGTTKYEVEQRERKRLIKLGKRKSREESDSSEIASRERSMTLMATDHSMHQSTVHRSIEGYNVHGMKPSPVSVRPGTFTALRGGKGGSRHGRH